MSPGTESVSSRIRPALGRATLFRVTAPAPGIALFWLPLGAGGHFVRLCGRIYEAVTSRLDGRAPGDLYHSALVVRLPGAEYAIESAPIRSSDGPDRGVIGEGPVGGPRA